MPVLGDRGCTVTSAMEAGYAANILLEEGCLGL